MSTQPFVPALTLSHDLFEKAVQPMLATAFPSLPYTACLIGSGSEVLGFDTERSTDHDWGVRLLIFLADDVSQTIHQEIDQLMREHLPATVHSYPTRFIESPLEEGTPVLADGPTDSSFRHGVTTGTLGDFLHHRFNIRSVEELDVPTWLTMTEQHLLEVTRGGVWRDDSGELTRTRETLAWYPDDVWRYRLAAGWKRIAQHEAFIGRTGEVDDDLGSHVISLAIVQDIMALSFLIERQYAPYEKWFGTAFSKLAIASILSPLLERARFERTWRGREAAIVEAGVVLAEAFNALGLCEPVDPAPRQYFNRPFQVLFADRLTDALLASITDPVVRTMPGALGGIDQYIGTTDGREWVPMHVSIRNWLHSLT